MNPDAPTYPADADAVLDAIAKAARVSVEEMRDGSIRSRRVMQARMAAALVMRRRLRMSYPECASALAMVSHSGARDACRRARREIDPRNPTVAGLMAAGERVLHPLKRGGA